MHTPVDDDSLLLSSIQEYFGFVIFVRIQKPVGVQLFNNL